MPGNRLIRFAVAAGLSVFVASCGSDDAALQQFAKKHRMSDIQTAAFMACTKGLRKNKPILPVAEGNLLMKSVPPDICACQAKTMTAVFLDNQYKGINIFAEYMAKETKKHQPRFSKKDLKPNIKNADAAKELEESLQSCVGGFRTAHKDEDQDIFEIVPVKQTDQKDGKTVKTAS